MSSRNRRKMIRRAYNQDDLARILTMPEGEFGAAFSMETVSVPPPSVSYYRDAGPSDYYHFRDNGSSVLAVAHLDTVVRPKNRIPRFSNTERGPMVTSGALDDRLGAYVILCLLPRLGIT